MNDDEYTFDIDTIIETLNKSDMFIVGKTVYYIVSVDSELVNVRDAYNFQSFFEYDVDYALLERANYYRLVDS